MAFGGTVAIRAMKDGDFVATIFPGTTAGLQAAIDFLAGGKGKVSVGPGTLAVDSVISLHSGCHLQGSGSGVTVIQRAAGSFTGTSPAYFANGFITTAFGENGTPNETLAKAQSNITISDLTLDGNYAAFSGVTFTAPGLITGHYGMKLFWVDKLRITNVEVKNFLQTGVETMSCRDVFIESLKVEKCGQYTAAASRNSLNFNNGYATAAANDYNKSYVANNLILVDSQDTHITLANVSNVAITNVSMDGSNIGIEMECTAGVVTTMKDITIDNVDARNGLADFFRAPPVATVSYENVKLSQCTVDFHPTLHGSTAGATFHAGCLFLGRTNDSFIRQFSISDCTFRNINSFNATSEAAWVVLGLPGTTASTDITLERCYFYGGNASHANNQNPGIFIYGNIQRVNIIDCKLFNCEDRAIYVSPQSGTTVSDVEVVRCYINASQADAYACFPGGTGTAKRVRFTNCVNVDCGVTSGRGFLIGTSAATDSTTFVHADGCQTIKTAGSIVGLEVLRTGASACNNIWLALNDMSQCGGSNYTITGGPSGLHYNPPAGIGTGITAAATIAIPTDGTVFHVTGNTNITNGITVSPIDNGRQITLVFDGTPTISDASTSKLNGNMVCTADDTLTLACDGSNWLEVARSSN